MSSTWFSLTRSLRPAPSSLVIALLVCSMGAEAGLIRGGGRGSSTIVTDTSAAGTVPFLVPDPDPDPGTDSNSQQFIDGAVPTISDASGAQAAAYGFGPLGRPMAIEHGYGRDCSLNIECSFVLGGDEALAWEAVLLGLPGDAPPEGYLALAGLTITWEFRAITELPDGISTTGPLPSRSLPGLSWTQTFTPDGSGGYTAGGGSAAVSLGPDLGYNPASDDLGGCFAIQSPDLPLGLQDVYAFGSCRSVGLDLSLAEPSGLTGLDLLGIADLAANEYLSLFVTAELNAPDGFQFANLYLEGGPLGNEIFDRLGEAPTPDAIRSAASDLLRYRGCAAIPNTACGRVLTNSQGLRVDVVPAPPAIALLAGGLLTLVGLRRRRERSESA